MRRPAWWRGVASSRRHRVGCLSSVAPMRSGVPVNDPAMTTDNQGDELRRTLDENRLLRVEIEGLRTDNERLHAENEQLRGRLNDLEAKLEAALRAGKRQSAPFSRGEPIAN